MNEWIDRRTDEWMVRQTHECIIGCIILYQFTNRFSSSSLLTVLGVVMLIAAIVDLCINHFDTHELRKGKVNTNQVLRLD